MTSTAWLSDYTTALQARDQREKAQEAHINACTLAHFPLPPSGQLFL